MINITAKHKPVVYTAPIDFRKGLDSLLALVRQAKGDIELDDYVFVFRNRARTAIKVLCYDGQGFWLCIKRLSRGKFLHWPTEGSMIDSYTTQQILTLLYNGNPIESQYLGRPA